MHGSKEPPTSADAIFGRYSVPGLLPRSASAGSASRPHPYHRSGAALRSEMRMLDERAVSRNPM